MQDARKVKWGVLGNAWIARDFMIPAMQKSKHCDLVAIASRAPLDPAFLPELRHFDSYEAMLNDPEVEAVYIPTPNALHAPWCIAAMERGKHVLCEKPLTMDAAECRALIDAEKRTGKMLMEAFMYHYSEKTRILFDILDSGALGKLRGIRATHGYLLDWASPARQDPKLGGGSLYDVGCYCVDYCNLIMTRLGASPVHATASFVMEGGVDVHANGRITYDNGVTCSIESWFDGAPSQIGMLYGEKGVLTVANPFDDEADATIRLVTAEGEKTYRTTAADNYAKEADVLSECILGIADNRMPLSASLADMQVIDMLYACK